MKSYDPTICMPVRRRRFSVRQRRYPVSARRLMLDYMPSFCWQTRREIVTMLEQIDEDLPESLIAANLVQMARSGEIEKRLIATPTRPGQVIDDARRGSSPYGVYEYKVSPLAPEICS